MLNDCESWKNSQFAFNRYSQSKPVLWYTYLIHMHKNITAYLMYQFSHMQFYTFTTYEVNITLTEEHPHGKILMDCVYPNAFTTLNSLFVLLSIPGINFCVIPCFPKLTIRVRIGIGLLLYCVGMVIIISIHAFSPNSYRQVRHSEIWCLLLPIIIFSVAETLTVVSGTGCNTQHILLLYE